jgi:18S rRNA (guanine1575-N7)-methyltransferase
LTKIVVPFKVGVYERNRPRKRLKVNKKGKRKGKQWVLIKKEQRRKKGKEVPPDSKYTARKRKAYF